MIWSEGPYIIYNSNFKVILKDKNAAETLPKRDLSGKNYLFSGTFRNKFVFYAKFHAWDQNLNDRYYKMEIAKSLH